MTDRAPRRYRVAVAGAAILFLSAQASPPPRPSADFRATSVTLTGLGSDRISSAARADNGDVVLGVIGSRGDGSIIRVTKRKRVTSLHTRLPVASVAVAHGRTCWVAFVRPVVSCSTGGAPERTYPIPGKQPAPQLVRSGPALFAVDATNGHIFTVGASSVDLTTDIAAGAAVAADAHGLVVVTQQMRCRLPLTSKQLACVTLRPPLDEARILAASGATVFVSDYPAASVTVVTSDGETFHRPLPSAPYSIIDRDGHSVWLGGRDMAGYLLLYAISSRDVRQYQLPSGLQGYVGADSFVLGGTVGDDLVLVDNHRRLVTFLTGGGSARTPGR